MDPNNDAGTLIAERPEHREQPEELSALLRTGNAMISQMAAMEKMLRIYNADNDTVRQAAGALASVPATRPWSSRVQGYGLCRAKHR